MGYSRLLDLIKGIPVDDAKKYWGSQNKVRKLGILGVGAYTGIYLLSRLVHSGANKLSGIGGQPTPGAYSDVYGRIGKQPRRGEGDFNSPIDIPNALDRGKLLLNSRAGRGHPPTGGLVQQRHRERIGHRKIGAARSRDQMMRLFKM